MTRRLATFLLAAALACSASKKKVTPPTLASVAQAALCADGGTLVLDGTGFAPGAAVSVATGGAGSAATSVAVSPDGTQATAQFPSSLPAGGPYDVTLANPDGGSATLAQAVRIVANPELFYVDPSVVWNGISVQATIYGAAFEEPVSAVSLVPSGGGTAIPLAFTEDPAKPQQVQATIPAGTPAGTYDVHLSDAHCSGALAAGLTVTSQVTLALGPVTPAEGWTGAANAVAITATGSAFEPVPRVYLNPSSGSSSTTSTALGAVAFVDGTDLTAVVPAGLPVGTYDVIVVNPDGGVGVALAAYASLQDPPPSIASLSPGALPNTGAQALTIAGANFRSPAVTLACEDALGAPAAAPAVTVASSTATTISATVDASGTSAADCVVTVTDGDGSAGQYAALVFTNPAQNLYAPVAGPALLAPRRAPVALGGDATSTARFLHVVGGDDGTGLATDTVETAPLSMLGAPGAFAAQRTRLGQARTFAGGARIGRFLYVAGGSDAGAALDSVERAAVLDPADRVQIGSVVLAVDPSAGVGPGLWYYRVAAVHDLADPVNPGGEDLPSDPFPVRLPALSGQKLDVTLTWAAVPGAASYRVYRSPTPGAAVGAEEVVAEVPALTTRFTDTGAAVVSTDTPLPIGSLGAWATLAAHLSVPREGPGVAWAMDPVDPTTAYLYVLGGRSDASAALSSVEYLPIALGADGTQTPAAAFTAATTALSAPRWQLAAASATPDLSPRVPAGTTFVYALSGESASGAMVTAADAAQVLPGGQLSAITALPQLHRAGYGTAIAGDFVFAFGGLNGQPDTGIVSGELCGSGVTGCSGATAPSLVNWNAEGVGLVAPVVNPGTTLSGAFVYVAGGDTLDPATLALLPTAATQYFLW